MSDPNHGKSTQNESDPPAEVEDDSGSEVTEEPATQAANHGKDRPVTLTDPDGTMTDK